MSACEGNADLANTIAGRPCHLRECCWVLRDLVVAMYEATMEDPKVFTRPWTIRMPLYRRIEPNAQLLEFKCVEFAEEFVYGRLIDK